MKAKKCPYCSKRISYISGFQADEKVNIYAQDAERKVKS